MKLSKPDRWCSPLRSTFGSLLTNNIDSKLEEETIFHIHQKMVFIGKQSEPPSDKLDGEKIMASHAVICLSLAIMLQMGCSNIPFGGVILH